MDVPTSTPEIVEDIESDQLVDSTEPTAMSQESIFNYAREVDRSYFFT